MTVRKILHYPNPLLEQQAEPVFEFNDELKTLVQDLKETLEAYQAHGIAAPQVGVLQRVFVVKLENGAKAFVNPLVVNEGDLKLDFEGCLSFPGVYERIARFEETTVTAQDETGAEFMLCLDGIEAVAVQHENEHLDGILMISHLKPVAKHMALKRLKKIKRKHFGR